jgi:hypothetical protein
VKGLIHWKIALALVVIFGAGMGTGWVAARRAIVARQVAMGRPGAWDGLMLKRMEDRLRLTPEQKAEVAPLVKEAAMRLQAQRRRAILEQVQTIRGFYEQVEPHLTVEQKEQLARAREQLREKMREDFPRLPQKPGGLGPPPGGPVILPGAEKP